MSKTIDLQIEKSQVLIDGLRKNLREVQNRNISASDLDGMDGQLKELAAANKECDAIRAELSAKVKTMNKILQNVKDSFAEKKKIIKGYYPQEEWMKFGVQDKR
jgi:hypothetical protein